MEIPEATEVQGIKPSDFLNESIILVFANPDSEVIPEDWKLEREKGDCVAVEKRKPKKGKGEFKQYAVFGLDYTGKMRIARFLFDRDLQTMRKAYGKNSATWIDKPVEIIGVADGEYTRLQLRVPQTTQVVTEVKM